MGDNLQLMDHENTDSNEKWSVKRFSEKMGFKTNSKKTKIMMIQMEKYRSSKDVNMKKLKKFSEMETKITKHGGSKR